MDRLFRFTAVKKNGDQIRWIDQFIDKVTAKEFVFSFLEQNENTIVEIEFEDITEMPELA